MGFLMKKIIIFLFLSVVMSNLVHAKSINMNDLTCEKYFSLLLKFKAQENNGKKEKVKLKSTSILSWLYGYAAAQNNSTSYDGSEFKKVMKKTSAKCKENLNEKITVVVSEAFKELK